MNKKQIGIITAIIAALAGILQATFGGGATDPKPADSCTTVQSATE